MSRVLVTGATGFLGRRLVPQLAKMGHEISVLARRTSNLEPFKDLKVKVFYGDITDRLQLLQATQNQDIVYHLAGFIAYKRSDREMMDKINVSGTGNVIDACITNSVSKLLHLSSVVTIGASFQPQPIDEEFEFNLSSYNLGYFETKREAELLVQRAVENDGLNAYIVNPSTIYGAGDGTKGSRKTQIKVAKGQFKLYPPGGVNVVHVDDVISGIELCLTKGKPGRRYILSGEDMTIKTLFEKIATTANVKAPNIPIPRWLLSSLGMTGDLLRKLGVESSLSSETAVTSSLYHWFSHKRAQEELGYRPRSADLAIAESIYWMKKSGLLEN